MPPRTEPFPPRRPEHPDDPVGLVTRSLSPIVGHVEGTAAVAAEPAGEPAVNAFIERDPSVNKSLLLRLIAGVRGL